MILDADTLEPDSVLSADVAVVGAGPGGIVTALELSDAGFDVLLVESGRRRFSVEAQQLGDAAELDPHRHAPMSLATRRQVGGTSVIWGGRCVPYDPIDFESRSIAPDVSWPVGYDELTPFFQRACDWFGCGRAAFDGRALSHLPASIVPGLPDGEVRTSTFERWSLPTDFGREYRQRLSAATRLRLVTGLTCTQVACASGEQRVDHLEARTLDGRRILVRARRYVLACGGLEGTRLLLASPGPRGVPIGDHSGHLGRWYMGHVEGVVARLCLSTAPGRTLFGYERDLDGVYVRRRMSFTAEAQRRLALPNIVAWLANPDLADPGHRSGALSFAYVALASPLGRVFAPEAQRLALTGEGVPGAPYWAAERGSVGRHLTNMLHDPWTTAAFVGGFGTRRFLARRRRVPGFFVYSPTNTYPLQFHGEHLPNRESRVMLSNARDRLGMPRLKIDIRFSEQDVEGVVHAHRHWDEHLRRHRCGHLEYLVPDVERAVRENIGGGFHQSGTTRMAARAEDGVLSADLAVHGFRDLFVVSSSAFVTSSQANSTFMIVVLALRMADRLRAELHARPPAVSSTPGTAAAVGGPRDARTTSQPPTLRVLMVTPNSPLEHGGVEQHVMEVGRRLAAAGVSVDVLCGAPGGPKMRTTHHDGVVIRSVQAWPRNRDYYLAPGLWREMARGDWDVVHVQSYHTFVAPVAMLRALTLGVPYVVTFHGGGHSSWVRQRLRGPQRRVLRPLLTRAARLVAIARFEIEQYGGALRIPREKFVLIPNGSDVLVAGGSIIGEAEPGLFASIGRLERYKGHHRAVAAMPYLLQRRPDARLLIVGEGPYEAALRRQVAKLGVQDHVEITSIAPRDRGAMADLLARVSLVVLLSDFESGSLAAIEAAAAGCSLLVADRAGLRELAEDGVARAVDPGAPAQTIAEAIIQELDRARAPRATRLMSWSECTAALLDLYREVSGNHRPAPGS